MSDEPLPLKPKDFALMQLAHDKGKPLDATDLDRLFATVRELINLNAQKSDEIMGFAAQTTALYVLLKRTGPLKISHEDMEKLPGTRGVSVSANDEKTHLVFEASDGKKKAGAIYLPAGG